MSGRTNRVGSHPAHEVEMVTTAQAEVKKAEHEAALDLRMVQVGAVAVAREALRLAAEVAAGRANAAHVRAVMTGCLNIPEVSAEALLAAPPVSRAEVLREVLDALGILSFSYLTEMKTHPLCTLRLNFSGKGTHPVDVHNLSKNEVAHAERAARVAFDAARDIISGMLRVVEEKPEAPSIAEPVKWLHWYAASNLGMTMVDAEAMDLSVLMERVRKHMEANPEPGAYARANQEKRAAFALAGQDATGPVFPMPGSTLPNAPLVLVTALRSWMDGNVDQTEVDVQIGATYNEEIGDSLKTTANAVGWWVARAHGSQGDEVWTATLRKKGTTADDFLPRVDPLTLRPEDIARARVSAWNRTTGRLTLLLKDASPKALADVGAALMRYGFHLDSGSLKQDPAHITRGVELGGELTDVVLNQTWTIEAQR